MTINNMLKSARQTSPALFGITLICFFLPFVTISCQQETLKTFSGIQLATGSTMQVATPTGRIQEQKIPGDPLAALAIISSIVGLGTSLIKARKTVIASAGSGAAGALLLLMLKSKLDDEAIKQGGGLILINYGLGFWLAFLLLVSASLVNIYTLTLEKEEEVEVKEVSLKQ